MRAGKLDKVITVMRWENEPEPDKYGTVTPAWVERAEVRAQIVQASSEEFIRNGAIDETLIIFRIRFLDGVTSADCVKYGGADYDIKEIKEIGRRQGLEIRAIARGAK